MNAPAILSIVGLSVYLSGVLPGQQPDQTAPESPVAGASALRTGGSLAAQSIASRFLALHRVDGELWGGGPDYKVLFQDDGITYTPALPAAPRNFPLRFTLESVGRGKTRAQVTPAQLSFADRTVRYARAGFFEEYEVRTDGLKQSFVFHELPVGTGDLVVRGRIDSELVAKETGLAQDGLSFERADVGGVTIGEVIGIDANGCRVRGSLHYQAGVLDFVLPAGFVGEAALPLVLDPLIGSVISIRTGSSITLRTSDVSYDTTNDVYLVVWEYWTSPSDHDVRAQRVAADGSLRGGGILVEPGLGEDNEPRAANVNVRDRFVVVWQRLSTAGLRHVFARSVSAATGSVSSRVTVAAGTVSPPAFHITPDVGGESTTVDDDAIVVWNTVEPSANTIRARQIQVAADGSLSLLSIVDITDGTWIDADPAISRSGGAPGRYLVVWRRDFSTSTWDPRAAVIDRNINILDSLTSLRTTPTLEEDDLEVDGDGTQWIAAWTTRIPGTQSDIAARAVFWDGSMLAYGSPVLYVASNPNRYEWCDAVCWVRGGTCLIGYRSGDLNAYVHAVDLFHCGNCEGRFALPPTPGIQTSVAMGSKIHGDPFTGGEEALIAHRSTPNTTTHDIRANRWRSDDGIVTSQGGACGGQQGSPYATCAIVGNADFTHRLRRARPASPAFLLLSLERLDAACGSCTIVPDPFTGFVLTTTTDNAGNAVVSTPIPNASTLVGLTAFEQWLVVDASSPGCSLLGTDISTALSVEIQ